ncbi:SDR family NAD(P)-dependent oxidoreductase [Novosphingobium sp.]|uniref:SDR family NAD(P)-dependent oxidoreductase n=1 Tax=Novosphingobium sp. TaxID=1874826 RepID=UPI00261ED894|nr:SDR family oxidoreductase [Novosphingobium sp.]
MNEWARVTTASLAGSVALVTGSGRGLGRAIASRLAELGADVAVHDISETAPAQFGEEKSLTGLAERLATEQGVRTTAVLGDISDQAQVEAMVAETRRALGPISILVNCAGGDIGAAGGKPDPNGALDIGLADARAIIDRNFLGTMLVCRAVMPGMAERKQGSVINFGSLNGHRAVTSEVVYGCMKAAIVHYTRCLALEMRPHGVRVNVVSPGPTMSARFLATRPTDPAMMTSGPDLDRYATPEEIAGVVAFLAGPDSGFVSGQVVRIDGAAGLYPA